jgi:hypothetical protein
MALYPRNPSRTSKRHRTRNKTIDNKYFYYIYPLFSFQTEHHEASSGHTKSMAQFLFSFCPTKLCSETSAMKRLTSCRTLRAISCGGKHSPILSWRQAEPSSRRNDSARCVIHGNDCRTGLLDEAPPISTLHIVSAISRAAIPRWQAPGRASLVPARAGHRNRSKGVFPWRTKNRTNRRTRPFP